MRKALQFLSLFLTATLLFSCSKKDDGASPNNQGDATWSMGTYVYARGASSQSSQANTNGGIITAIATTTVGAGGNYGAFSGSALTMTFYSNLGEGKYTLAPTEVVVANPGARFINIDCTIGTAVNTGAVLYSLAASSGVTADVTKDSNGKFHVTVSTPVTLTKKIVVGGGIADAKGTYDLTIKNAY